MCVYSFYHNGLQFGEPNQVRCGYYRKEDRYYDLVIHIYFDMNKFR